MDTQLTAAAQWLNSTFAGFDEGVTLAVHKLYDLGGGFLTPLMNFISFLGKGGICLILLSLILMAFVKTRRFGTAMLLGLAIGALFTNLYLKVAVARPRPYADPAGVFYPLWQMMGQHMESDMSFPSGHTTAAFASMVPVFLLGNKKISWTALVFAFLMGVSRIYLVVHFPSDVLGGLLVGTVAGVIAVLLIRFIPEGYFQCPLEKFIRVKLLRQPEKGRHEC